MRFPLAVSAFFFASAALGETTCSSPQLTEAAHRVATMRRQLHAAHVAANSSRIPLGVAAQLGRLKDALTESATAAFASCGVAASAEAMQQTLEAALQLNGTTAASAGPESDGKEGSGAFGADLGVQVFELFGTPRLFEVDFRYSMECGDDNLLLVFRSASDRPEDGWHQELRYGASTYTEAGDALGDFVLLSPLPGSVSHPLWRYVVAHGKPSCTASPRPSEFTLELLTPGATAAHPEHTWHFVHPYRAGEMTPRLATTEGTIDFSLVPGTAAAPAAAEAQPGQKANVPAVPEEFRFRLTAAGAVEPLPAEAQDAPPPPHASAKP